MSKRHSITVKILENNAFFSKRIIWEMLKISRKSPYYRENNKKQKKIQKKDIIMLRPFTGFQFLDFKKIINKKLNKNVKKNQKISVKDFIKKR